MCVGVAPRYAGQADALPPVQPVISRELLRSACEPFFDQMLTALQMTLHQQQQQQQQQKCPRAEMPQATSQTAKDPQAAFPTNFAAFHQRTHLEPMPDDESTEADEPVAFASLLSD